MPEEVLKVGIQGDASGLEQASKQAASALNKIEKSATTATKTLDKFPNISAKVSQSANVMAASAGKAGGAMPKLATGSNQATQALVNLSRVAQDAPFGFIGIANNINPLLESFQRLKAETGTTGGALKALSGSLMGAGGLGLAVGVVSSLLVVFGDKLFSSGKAAESQADQVKKARQALDDYVDGLNDLDKARVKGLQNAQEELVNLKTLYDATQNVNIPIAQRKKLVDELQDQYPKYFANIKDEIILAGGAKDAYDKLSTSILAAAKARAAQDTLVDIEKQVLAVNQEISTNAANQIKLQQQLNALRAKGTTTISATGEERLTSAGAQANKIQQQLNSSVSDGNGLLKQRNDLLSRANVLSDNISKIVEKTPEALLKPTANLPKVDKGEAKKDNDDLKKLLEEKKDILLEFIKDFEAIKIPFPKLSMKLEDFSIKGLTDELRDKLNKELTSEARFNFDVPVDFQTKLIDTKSLRPIVMPFDIQIKIANADKIEKAAQAQAKQINQIFNDAIAGISVEGLSSIGEAIGAALSGGNIGDVFKQFEVMLGGAVQALGKQIIALNVAALLAKKSLKLTFVNPAIGIAAGIALVAVGTALKAIAGGGIKGFAKGGWVGGQGNRDTVPAMLTPGEFVVTKDKAPFVASILKFMGGGLKMPKVINNTYHFAEGGFVPQTTERLFPVQRMKRLLSDKGSASTVNIQGQFKVIGRDLVYVLSQNQQSQQRNFGR